MTVEFRRMRAVAATVSVLASGAVLSGCLAGPTYGTGKGAHEQLLEDVTGILEVTPKRDETPIEYKPRPELVRPATTASLPAPQDTVASAGNAAWPESPEQRRQRIRAEATLNRDNIDFTPEVAPPTVAASAADSGSVTTTFGPRSRQNVEFMDTGRQREDFNRRLAISKQGSPTTRRYLSEPPLAYREPSAGAPTDDVGEDEWKKEKRLKAEARKNTKRTARWADWVPWMD